MDELAGAERGAMITLVDSAGVRHTGLTGELTLPLRGAWTAHVETGEAAALTGPVTLEIQRDGAGAGVDVFQGVVRYGGAWQGRSEVAIVGGAGGLVGELEPVHYAAKGNPVPAELVVASILRDAGETAAPSPDLDGLELGQWTRARLTAGALLGLLAEELGIEWRVLDDGTVWLGLETWPDASPADIGYEIGEEPDARRIRIAPDQATLRPGMSVLGRQIHRVSYSVGGGGIRAALSYGRSDRAEASEAVRAMVAPLVYRASYAAAVVQQHDDDTIDVSVGNRNIPDLRRIPFRVGLGGARVLLRTGARVRVAFEAGDPSGAYAHSIDMASASAASRGIARSGEAISCGFYKVNGAGKLVKTNADDPDGLEIKGTITGAGSSEVFLR